DSGFGGGGDQRLDITEGERIRLQPLRISGDLRHVIGHDHSVVTDFFVDAHRLQHVHVAVVNERLLEIEKTPANIAEMDVEDFSALAEISNDIEDLFAGIFEHLRDRTLTEIQPVIFARNDLDESLQPGDIAEHGVNAAIAFIQRHSGIVRVT